MALLSVIIMLIHNSNNLVAHFHTSLKHILRVLLESPQRVPTTYLNGKPTNIITIPLYIKL